VYHLYLYLPLLLVHRKKESYLFDLSQSLFIDGHKTALRPNGSVQQPPYLGILIIIDHY
jgi:hypothetical protein